ncbi:nitroreductase family deazaflavin-dependent oxidoreductase [Actinomadura sp. KC216]|uniref:nitroreductase family deazaflavin-dependent oxidoreductase n=1 Tax=Actinomadura sp. KC216 TaxID=2530370 RepID=UPI001049C635|nr:nitroreductase family deazaflavin-dependent oxidoreductase [Actinomadura sp. KC216]TDB82119.1 nitroreductase family deazaflavin-dependent oxidoreductase [Actinomadura sp. KC216]
MLYGKEHVARYQETDGAEGHDWNGTVTLLLTTTGRRSGKEGTTPLIYQRDGDAHVIVASDGGNDDDPLWYKNIQANPEVKVQVKGDKFTARARTATADEKPALWKKMTAVWPDYDEYQTKTNRDIPVVLLERV